MTSEAQLYRLPDPKIPFYCLIGVFAVFAGIRLPHELKNDSANMTVSEEWLEPDIKRFQNQCFLLRHMIHAGRRPADAQQFEKIPDAQQRSLFIA